MPMAVTAPPAPLNVVTPTTARASSSASGLAGSFRATVPFLRPASTCGGTISASTLRPTASAVAGLTPGPTPPKRAPAIAWCSFSAPPQNASSPKVSKRKICAPRPIISDAFCSMTASKVPGRAAAPMERCARTLLDASEAASTAVNGTNRTADAYLERMRLLSSSIGLRVWMSGRDDARRLPRWLQPIRRARADAGLGQTRERERGNRHFHVADGDIEVASRRDQRDRDGREPERGDVAAQLSEP